MRSAQERAEKAATEQTASQKAERLARLQVAASKVEEQLDTVRVRIKGLRRQQAGQLDPAALRSALLRLDEQILTLRYSLAQPTDREVAARRGLVRPDFDNLGEGELNSLIDTLPEARPAATDMNRTRDAYDRLLNTSGTDPAVLAAAKAKFDASLAKLVEVRKPLRDKAVQVSRESWETRQKAELKREAAEQADRDRRAGQLDGRRSELVLRVAEAEERATAARRLADEERVLVETLVALTRQRLAIELGVSLPVGPAGPTDHLTDRFDQLDRQLAELKAALSAQDGTSRLDAIERTLEQIRRAPGVQRR